MQFDFNSIKTEFKSRLSLLNDWRETLFYGVYDRLADTVAYTTEKLAYLAETYYRESGWTTAQKIKSLANQAEHLNYYPHRKKGAAGTVDLSADSNFSNTYIYSGTTTIIPKWTQFSNEDEDVQVYSVGAVTYYSNTVGNETINVKEGEVKEFTYTALGNDNEIVTLTDDSVEEDYIQVDIVDANGAVLNNVNICGEGDNAEKLRFITDTTNYYCEVKNSNTFEKVEVKFGDNIYGRKLTAGERVKITYAQTKGSEGNITQVNTISKINDTIVDANENEVTLYVRNSSEISNGEDVEDIEHIRNYGNRLFVSGYRCGGIDDWLTILENHQYIYKAQVANAEDIGTSLSTDLNKVFVTAISTDGDVLTTSQKSTIVTDLKDNNYKSVTETISWYDPIIVYLLFDIDAKIENQPFTTVRSLIKTSLSNEYGTLYTNFQQNIYESNYINFIDDIDYVSYHDTEIFHLDKNNIDIAPTTYVIPVSYTAADTAVLEDQIFLQPDTFQIWIYRKRGGSWDSTPYKIAEDQSGSIVGLQGDLPIGTYNIINDTVNYPTNTVTYIIKTIVDDPVGYGIPNPTSTDNDGYILSIAYKTQDGNGEQLNHIRLPESRFITGVDETYIFSSLSYI